jgi:hypothetical protein
LTGGVSIDSLDSVYKLGLVLEGWIAHILVGVEIHMMGLALRVGSLLELVILFQLVLINPKNFSLLSHAKFTILEKKKIKIVVLKGYCDFRFDFIKILVSVGTQNYDFGTKFKKKFGYLFPLGLLQGL